MKRGIWPVAVLLLALARPAFADELTPAERTWARTCVTGLTATSARQRESAAAALARLGPGVVAVIASAASSLKTDEHWAAVQQALSSMDPTAAAKAVEATHKAWPPATVGRRLALVEHLQSLARKKPPVRVPGPKGAVGAGKPIPDSPDDVAAQVREILDSFDGESTYSGDDARVRQLASLGRPAVGAMLADLCRKGDLAGFRATATATALRRLLIVDDVPTVAQMLLDGHLDVAPALTRLSAEVVVPVLIAPRAKGMNSFTLVEALGSFSDDPRVAPALVAWLETDPDGDGSSLVGSAAELLAKTGDTTAAPALLVALERASGMNRRLVAAALVTLGEKRGIEALLALFRRGGSVFEGYDRHEAGNKLNEVAGRRIYKGRFSMPGEAPEGNFDEAVTQFDAWWAEVKDTIRYDETRRAWVTP